MPSPPPRDQNLIQIDVESGALKYTWYKNGASQGDGRVVHVHNQDTLEWAFNNGSCACVFKRDGALDDRVFAGGNRGSSHTQRGNVTGRHANGGNNTYRYLVAVVLDGSGVSLVDDPDVIIDSDPSPTPPGKKK